MYHSGYITRKKQNKMIRIQILIIICEKIVQKKKLNTWINKNYYEQMHI